MPTPTMPRASRKHRERRRPQGKPLNLDLQSQWPTPVGEYLLETAGKSSGPPSPGPVLAAACNLEETMRGFAEQEQEDLEEMLIPFGQKFAESLKRADEETIEECWDEVYEKLRRKRQKMAVEYRARRHHGFRQLHRQTYDDLLDECWDRIDTIRRVKPHFFERNPEEDFEYHVKRIGKAQHWLDDVFEDWWKRQRVLISRNPPMFDDPNVSHPCWSLVYLFKKRVAEKVTYPDIGFTVRWEETKAPTLDRRPPVDPDFRLCIQCEAGKWRCRTPVGQDCTRCTRLGLECTYPWPWDPEIIDAFNNRTRIERNKSKPLPVAETEPFPLLETEPFPLFEPEPEPEPDKHQTKGFEKLSDSEGLDPATLLDMYELSLKVEKECWDEARRPWVKMLYVGGEAQFVTVNEKIWSWALPAIEFDEDKKKWVPKSY